MRRRLVALARRIWDPIVRWADKHPYVLALLVGIAVGSFVYWLAGQHDDAIPFYGDKLRGSLFSGFLSMGSFLLSLKTFIVVKMKEGLYDQASYKQRHLEAVRTGGPRKMYTPIFALRGFLLWSIITALATAVLQVTVGLFKKKWAVAIPIGSAALTLTLLMRCLFEINGNLKTWFSHAEEMRQEELDKAGVPKDPAGSGA
jgi:hypothetical protein